MMHGPTNIKHILCFITFCPNRAAYEIVWKKYGAARQATDDNITRRMRFACWIKKAIDTHSEYVIVTVFSQQQWSGKCTPIFHYTYFASLVDIAISLTAETCSWFGIRTKTWVLTESIIFLVVF